MTKEFFPSESRLAIARELARGRRTPEARSTKPVMGVDRTEYGLPWRQFLKNRMLDYGGQAAYEVPVLGEVLSAKDATNSLLAGDYVGAGANAIAANPLWPAPKGGVIKLFHGAGEPHKTLDADYAYQDNGVVWFSTRRHDADDYSKLSQGLRAPAHGGSGSVWSAAKPIVYELEVPTHNLREVDVWKDAQDIALEVGLPQPNTWDDVDNILRWGDYQKELIRETDQSRMSGVLFRDVDDNVHRKTWVGQGYGPDHVALWDQSLLSKARRLEK